MRKLILLMFLFGLPLTSAHAETFVLAGKILKKDGNCELFLGSEANVLSNERLSLGCRKELPAGIKAELSVRIERLKKGCRSDVLEVKRIIPAHEGLPRYSDLRLQSLLGHCNPIQ